MADREVEDGLARSFLADLPAEVAGRLRAEGERADYLAGTTVYRPRSGPGAALVVSGLLRVYLASLERRQVTVRYARPGEVQGIAVPVMVEAAVARCGPRSSLSWPQCDGAAAERNGPCQDQPGAREVRGEGAVCGGGRAGQRSHAPVCGSSSCGSRVRAAKRKAYLCGLPGGGRLFIALAVRPNGSGRSGL